MTRPADIARRVRDLADKRDKQAAVTANPAVRDELIATARNYRALATELERKTPEFGPSALDDSAVRSLLIRERQ